MCWFASFSSVDSLAARDARVWGMTVEVGLRGRVVDFEYQILREESLRKDTFVLLEAGRESGRWVDRWTDR
jgi:hypothetical protein